MGSMLSAIFGCLVLVFTDNAFGAGTGRLLRRRGLRQHLSAGGRGHRPPLSLLPSRILQRHLLVCAGGRPAGSGHARVRSVDMGSRRGHGDPASGYVPGDGSPAPDLAGIEGDRKMKTRAPRLFLLCVPTARRRPAGEHSEAARFLSRRAHRLLGHTDRGPRHRQDALRAQPRPLFRPRLQRQALQHRAGPHPPRRRLHVPNPRARPDPRPTSRAASADRCAWSAAATPISPRAPFPIAWVPLTGNPLAAIEDLADQLVARGVKRVDGDIIGDDTWYVWQPYAAGWARGRSAVRRWSADLRPHPRRQRAHPLRPSRRQRRRCRRALPASCHRVLPHREPRPHRGRRRRTPHPLPADPGQPRRPTVWHHSRCAIAGRTC